MIYFDTGLLVKALCPEPGMAMAHEIIRGCKPPLPFTDLHALETRNAVRLKRFRNELTDAEVEWVLGTLAEDLESGLLAKPPLDLPSVFHRAEQLSRRHAAVTGARSLDILHVAAALELGATAFASLDERQRALARKAGLKLLPRTLAWRRS